MFDFEDFGFLKEVDLKDCGMLKEVSLLQILKQSAADYINSFDPSLHVCMHMDIYYSLY